MISRSIRVVALTLCVILVSTAGLAAEPKKPAKPAPPPPEPVEQTYHLTGLFAADCEPLLRDAVKSMAGVELLKLDLDRAEATFRFIPATAFPGTKPADVPQRFDQALRQNAGNLISAKPVETPASKLAAIDLELVPLDCRACCLAVHEMLMKADGVQQALVNMKTGRVHVMAEPEKADRDKLEKVLKSREVAIKQPATKPS